MARQQHEEREHEEIVIDASIAVKWFNPEDLSPKALKLRTLYVENEIDLVAPTLFNYEVINALRWNSEFSEHDVLAGLQSLTDILIRTEDVPFYETIKIAYRSNLTIYDASYVALAKRFDTILITADHTLVRNARQEECVVSLKKYDFG